MNYRQLEKRVLACARAAGKLIRKASRQERSWSSKGHNDFVTSADLASEEMLRTHLAELLPEASFQGEESGGESEGLRWIVDPLDGTTNFLHGYPHSAVSIALAQDETVLLGVVHDFYRGETFRATRGGGAWLGGKRLRVSSTSQISDALLVTGFTPGFPRQYEIFAELDQASRGIRRDCCASLALSYVASGRVSAFWEIDLKPWDVAAGILLIEEAGGAVTDLSGRACDWRIREGNYLASNGALHPALLPSISSLI